MCSLMYVRLSQTDFSRDLIPLIERIIREASQQEQTLKSIVKGRPEKIDF